MRKDKRVTLRFTDDPWMGNVPNVTSRRIEGSLTTEVVFEGDLCVEVEDLTDYVQVQFINGYSGQLYTYVDPGLGLKVGDLVDVPTRFEKTNIALVKKLGDGFGGKAEKTVTARFVREPAEKFFSEAASPRVAFE